METNGIFEFPEISIDSDHMMMVRTPSPVWDDKRIRSCAQSFGIGDVKTTEIGPRIVLRGEAESLTLFRTSDSVWWQKELGEEEEPAEGIEFQTDKDSLAAAEEFLREKELANDHMKPDSVTYSEVARMGKGGKVLADYRVAQYANFAFGYEGLPLVGPGAKAQVTFGADSAVIEAYRFWRAVEPYKEYPIIGADEAVEALTTDPAFANLREGEARISFRRVFLAYHALPPRMPQQFLFPVYVFEGTVSSLVEDDQELVKRVAAARIPVSEAKCIGVPQALLERPAF